MPVALVAGAAGDIGQALCSLLAERGVQVIGWDIAERPATLAVAAWHLVDLTDGDVPASVAMATREVGELRHVFVVVGGSDAGELQERDLTQVPMEVFQRTVALNLCAAYAVVRATIQPIRDAAGDRSYTLVSSLNAYGGYGAPGYSAAKAGLHGLARTLAPALGRDGIRVNAVALGTTETERYARLAAELGGTADFAALGRNFPRGRVLSPVEAATALVSVGVDNPAVTGAVIVADGAQSLVRRRSTSVDHER